MAGRIAVVSRANCVVNLRKGEIIDLEPLQDIKDTSEDRKLYPNDWMGLIFMTQNVYGDLLRRLKPTLRHALPWLHPNKALWVTLRHMVIGDTVRSMEERAVVVTCLAIKKELEDEFFPEEKKMPNFRREGPAIAADFEKEWDVQNCLGAIVGKLFASEHLDLYMTTTFGQRVHAEMHWTVMVDAKLRIMYINVLLAPEHSSYETLLDLCSVGKSFNVASPPCPPPSAPKGSKVKLPYTFVGEQKFGARKWLRVATPGKDEENKEIERGLIPANVTMNLLRSRFGILKLKHPLMLKNECMVNCFPVLHNYFMQKNPAYGELKGIMEAFHAKKRADKKQKVVVPGFPTDISPLLLFLIVLSFSVCQ